MVWASLMSAKHNRSRMPSNSEHRDITPTRNVCRNLFGPVDHREIRKEIEKDKRELVAAKKSEYNFDFQKEEPFAGRYLWEKTCSLSVNPSICSKLCEPPTMEEPLVTKNETPSTNFMQNDSCNLSPKRNPREHKMTDFFRAKKRKHEEISSFKADHTASMSSRLNQSNVPKMKTIKCEDDR